jgi:hypothetical protein
MAYFPKSQIETNLYTNGEEYLLSTTQEIYIGYYYKTSLGQRYTGKIPQDGPNILLQIINKPLDQQDAETIAPSSSPNEIKYTDASLTPPPSPRFIPQFNPTLPTDKDKSLGVFSRYFCKKNNELIYKEINKETFTKLRQQSQDIAWDLYTPQTILWYIKGDKEKTYNANKGMVVSLEQKQNWYGFSQYLKEDYLRYYLGS